MSEGYYCNLPELLMTEHKLTDGIARVHDGSQTIEIEPWVTERGGTMTFYREDAAVLRYLADALEGFDVPRPAEEAEEEEGDEPADIKKVEPRRPESVKDGSTQLPQEFALR